MFLKKRRNYHETYPGWRCTHEKLDCALLFWKQARKCHCVLISSPLSPSRNECETNPSEHKRTQLCLQIELAEEKSRSLHSQKSPWWAQQMYFTKRKNRCSECYKSFVYRPVIGTKHFDKLKPEIRPDPERPARLTTLLDNLWK